MWFVAHPEIQLLPWSAKVADLNPTENIWDDIVNESECYRPRSADECFGNARCVWDGIAGNIIGKNELTQYFTDIVTVYNETHEIE